MSKQSLSCRVSGKQYGGLADELSTCADLDLINICANIQRNTTSFNRTACGEVAKGFFLSLIFPIPLLPTIDDTQAVKVKVKVLQLREG